MKYFALFLGLVAYVGGLLAMIVKPEETLQFYILGALWFIIAKLEDKL